MFKLQQYAKSFEQMGFSEDVYKLTMISAKKKAQLVDSVNVAHKQRFTDMFKRIEQLYPKQNVQRTLDKLDNANRGASSR